LCLLLPKGKTRVFNILSKLSTKDWKYSRYNVKITNQSFNDLTYRLSLGAGYGFFYSQYLKSLSKKFVFLDFGSNLGIYSLISSYNLNCKHLVAFDPLPNIKKIILKNFKLNKVNGKFYNFGIYNKNIKKKLYTIKNHSGISSIIKHNNKNNFINATFKNYLFLKKIESNYKKYNFIIKIDVEGAEQILINELKKSNILKSTKSIFVEIREPKLLFKKKSIISQLKKNNFFLKKFVKPHDYLFEKF
tara:strand:+ start:309 stop:1046 length:738 start_codon:yes stop_codon:yes gene_type:complete